MCGRASSKRLQGPAKGGRDIACFVPDTLERLEHFALYGAEHVGAHFVEKSREQHIEPVMKVVPMYDNQVL